MGALKLSVTLFVDVQEITHSEIKSTSNIHTTCKCPWWDCKQHFSGKTPSMSASYFDCDKLHTFGQAIKKFK